MNENSLLTYIQSLYASFRHCLPACLILFMKPSHKDNSLLLDLKTMEQCIASYIRQSLLYGVYVDHFLLVITSRER